MGSRASLFAVAGVLVLCVVYAAHHGKPWEQPGTRAGEEIVGPDGGTMVWVPPGEFVMGSPEGEGEADEHPAHRVRITRGFWLGKFPVTNAEFRRFCHETWHLPFSPGDQDDNRPLASVDESAEKGYCKHFGLDLPTEAQWEYAARGPEGRRYPWGNEWDPKKCCNPENQNPGGKLIPVGSFPQGASWCGAMDLVGDVFQDCKDRYSAECYASSPDTDPRGPDSGRQHVMRGGFWEDSDRRCSRAAYRGAIIPSGQCFGKFGFRCVRDPHPSLWGDLDRARPADRWSYMAH